MFCVVLYFQLGGTSNKEPPFDKVYQYFLNIILYFSNTLCRVFGPALVPKIEAYIRDEYNGEQCPGTSFILETGSLPCKYIVCTSVVCSSPFLY